MTIKLNLLSERNKAVFNQIIDTYLISGSPIGSQTLSNHSKEPISSASLRNIMSELEEMGLLYSPHISSGRLPTEQGLRLYVDSLMGFSIKLENEEISFIEELELAGQRGSKELLSEASVSLSGISSHAGIVVNPRTELDIKHIEFMRISQSRVLVILIDTNGSVENRIINIPKGITGSVLEQAGNYLNSKIKGQNIEELRKIISDEIKSHRVEIDVLAERLINQGLAVWANDELDSSLIVCGHDKLLDDVNALEDLERIKSLFASLGKSESSISLLEDASEASGVQIFIGSESRLFNGTGCSLVIAPYKNTNNKIIGALGVIGPTRMNYSKIIPIVDYTSQVVTKLLAGENLINHKSKV